MKNCARHQNEKEMNAQLKRVLDNARCPSGMGWGYLASPHYTYSFPSLPCQEVAMIILHLSCLNHRITFSFYFIMGKEPGGNILKI
jgi:hypothetical protein